MRWLVDWLFTYNTRKEHDIHTKQVKKNYWRIRISILYFFYSNSSLSLSPPISYFDNAIAKNQTISFFFFLLFRQCHCHKPIATNFFFCHPISAMPLPQIFSPLFWPTNQLQQFFSLLFRQCHCHKFIPTIFFPSISVMPLSQIHYHKFSPLYFSNALPQINCHFFFFFWEMICAHYFLQQILNGRLLLIVIVGLKK